MPSQSILTIKLNRPPSGGIMTILPTSGGCYENWVSNYFFWVCWFRYSNYLSDSSLPFIKLTGWRLTVFFDWLLKRFNRFHNIEIIRGKLYIYIIQKLFI